MSGNIGEQLGHLKAMTARTGILHDAQVLQIQMWPMIAIPTALSSTAEVDTKNKKVYLYVVVNKKPSDKITKRAIDAITEGFRMFLWDETTVEIEYREVKNGTGKGNKSPKPRRSKNPK